MFGYYSTYFWGPGTGCTRNPGATLVNKSGAQAPTSFSFRLCSYTSAGWKADRTPSSAVQGLGHLNFMNLSRQFKFEVSPYLYCHDVYAHKGTSRATRRCSMLTASNKGEGYQVKSPRFLTLELSNIPKGSM